MSAVPGDLSAALYVVSDVHGYADDLRRGLTRAGLVDGDGAWIGDGAALWVLGDLMDRGPDGIGVVRLLRSLQQQAPSQVHVLLGNHEALAVGRHLFPESSFGELWVINGGHGADQEALTAEEVEWLRTLPAMGRVGDYLLVHSDTAAYLTWGDSVDAVNETLHEILRGDDVDQHYDVFARLTSRYHFIGSDGTAVAQGMLRAYGGECLVHGHSIIGTLLDMPSSEVDRPLLYAEGTVLAIDGGRYDGGPLLLVRLE